MNASAIINERSVILVNVSRVLGNKFFQAVKYLVDRCRELADVKVFEANAAFANIDVCRYIEHVGEKYVMKKRHRNRVTDALDQMDGRLATATSRCARPGREWTTTRRSSRLKRGRRSA